MKFLLFLSFSLCIFNSYSQAEVRRIDSIINVAHGYENDGAIDNANSRYESLLTSLPEDNVYYGDLLLKVLNYYLIKKNSSTAYDYYIKIINSSINDRDIESKRINEPFKNYRYRASKLMAEFYHQQGDHYKSLEYLDLLEFSIPYQTTLLSNYKAEKIDLTSSRSKIYLELGQKDSAFYFLFKRALEYDYTNQFTNFTSNHKCIEEKMLSETIFAYYKTGAAFKAFKINLDSAINTIEYKKEETNSRIKLEFQNMTYIIPVSTVKETKEDYIAYLKNSPLYISLTEKLSGIKN
jgi:hypothetical protein